MREDELLLHIAKLSGNQLHSRETPGGSTSAGAGGMLVGPGDDCAVLDLGVGGAALLITVDHLIEGVHVECGEDEDFMARKAIARSVSDIAAMGGTPKWSLATAAFGSEVSQSRGTKLAERMHFWGEQFGCPVVGGDIGQLAKGNTGVVLTTTVLGVAHSTRGPVLRSGARVGDRVFVSGKLGNSLASGRHMRFMPRVELGQRLCDELGQDLTAMMDISDGVGIDSDRLAKASGVRLEIDGEKLPLHEDVPGAGGAGFEAVRRGLSDGEDYELLACVSAQMAERAQKLGLTLVGHVVPMDARGAGSEVVHDGVRYDGRSFGYVHGDDKPR